MLFDDLHQFLYILPSILTVIFAAKFAHQISITRHAKKEPISYELYIAYRNVWLDALTQSLIFLIFDWYIAALLWLVSILSNFLLFVFLQKRSFYASGYRNFKKREENISEQKTSFHSQITRAREYFSSSEKGGIRSFFHGTAVSTPKYHVSWLSIHLSAPALLWIRILYTEASLLSSVSCSTVFGQITYDILCSYGICALVYWGGYIADAIHYRFDGWRRWYHIGYSIFFAIWWILFVLIELHIFA